MALPTSFGSFAVHRLSKDVLQKVKGIGSFRRHFRSAVSDAEPPQIPSPTLFENLNNENSPDGIPTVAQCAVHLKLLQTILVLHDKVIDSNTLDRSFGIKPKESRKDKHDKIREGDVDSSSEEQRAVKWDYFIFAAVVRFIQWWESLEVTEINDDNLPPLGRFSSSGIQLVHS